MNNKKDTATATEDRSRASFDGESLDSFKEPERWQLIKDVFAFQFKLAIDGFRDLLLSPASLVAALLGLIISGDQPGRYFYTLLRWGHSTDAWIGLFTAGDTQDESTNSGGGGSLSPDDVIQRVEQVVAQEMQRPGPVNLLKSIIDKLLDLIRWR